MNIERKRERQRDWVRAKRRSNPAYAQAERIRHEDWRARHLHHVELYNRVRLTRARASSNAADVEALSIYGTRDAAEALGISDTYWDDWIDKAEQRFADHDESTCPECIYYREVRDGVREWPDIDIDALTVTVFARLAVTS